MSLPKIHVKPTISPSRFTFPDPNCTLILTATLTYTHPITIYTRLSIFNLDLAQNRHNFSCQDLTTNTRLSLSIESPNILPGFTLHIGCHDDQFLVTLYPGIPVKFEGKFVLATRVLEREMVPLEAEGKVLLATRVWEGKMVKKGHRYRFGMKERCGRVGSRLHGTREEVMTREHTRSREHERSDVEIEFESVEFEVLEDGKDEEME